MPRNRAAIRRRQSKRAAAPVDISNATELWQHFDAAGDTTLKTGSGRLERVVVNNPQSGRNLLLYNNTAASGALIASMPLSVAITFEYGLTFDTGLTVSITGAGTFDLTVIYS